MGRIDRQVKIRGRRVELSEIEAVMTSHSAIQLGAVLLKEYTAGQQALIAFMC